jgi:acid stress-induced BolA-like protein IbaG/YrbA
LVFTWDWEDPTTRVGDTQVTVEFKGGDGIQTEVVVTHEAFADAARVRRHEQGWTELLELLAHTVSRRHPKASATGESQ